jgi:hypothetical protein
MLSEDRRRRATPRTGLLPALRRRERLLHLEPVHLQVDRTVDPDAGDAVGLLALGVGA